jgi:ElaB/YqjD/DUF883 family membrane-anchored ribosome-binding protein/vacuolar-type H+-ATPase subunit H
MTQFNPPVDRDPAHRTSADNVVRPGESVYASGDDDAVDQDDPDQIKVEIAETRVELSATIDALQERLNPSVLMEQAKEHAQEAVHEATEHAKEAVHEATVGKAEQIVSNATDRASGVGSTIMDTIRQNPLPAAIAGISLGWLFMKRSRGLGYNPPVAAHSGEHYWAGNASGVRSSSGGGIGHVAGQVQDRVGTAAERAQERASDLAEQVTDTASHLADTAQLRARRVQGRMGDLLEENPLMAGALALTVGAAIGLAAPSTEQEHALFGESRDNVMRRVRGTAREMGQKVQRVAEQAQDAAIKAADEEKLTTSPS